MQSSSEVIIRERQERKENKEKETSCLKKRKKMIILISLASICLIIAIILIIIFTTKKANKEEKQKDKEKENVKIDLSYVKSFKYCSYSIIELKALNLDQYSYISNTDISFNFTTENSTVQYYSDSLIDNIIKIKIPEEAISGNVYLKIEKINFSYNFSIEIIKEIALKINENITEYFGSGLRIEENLITYIRNNFSIIYYFTAPCNCTYNIEISSSSPNDDTYINADLDSNLTILQNKGRNIESLTKKINTGNYNNFEINKYGSFYLEENKKYYLRISIIKMQGMYACNINGLKLTPNEDQNKTPIGMGYSIFEFDFKNEAYFPFFAGWAMSPNYIKIENEYAEFYFNQTFYDTTEGQRMYKGAELTGNFFTNKDGWYGLQLYLTDDFPKDVGSTIIVQIFNQGRSNSWAGHLHIN